MTSALVPFTNDELEAKLLALLEGEQDFGDALIETLANLADLNPYSATLKPMIGWTLRSAANSLPHARKRRVRVVTAFVETLRLLTRFSTQEALLERIGSEEFEAVFAQLSEQADRAKTEEDFRRVRNLLVAAENPAIRLDFVSFSMRWLVVWSDFHWAVLGKFASGPKTWKSAQTNAEWQYSVENATYEELVLANVLEYANSQEGWVGKIREKALRITPLGQALLDLVVNGVEPGQVWDQAEFAPYA